MTAPKKRGRISKSRGYGKAVVERFLLGYAPDGWEGLAEAARQAGLPQAMLLQAGLVKEGRDPGRVYDAFRHRVMFPTRNLAGRVIAFNGRRLRDDDPAKYINSPETAVYHKGRELFGLWEARGEIRTRDEAILVEGPTDCLSLVMAGIPIAVASLGTSLTEPQARLLKRFTSRVFILYDGDSAGRAAARRAVDILLGRGRDPARDSAARRRRPRFLRAQAGRRGGLEAAQRSRALAGGISDGAGGQAARRTHHRRARIGGERGAD